MNDKTTKNVFVTNKFKFCFVLKCIALCNQNGARVHTCNRISIWLCVFVWHTMKKLSIKWTTKTNIKHNIFVCFQDNSDDIVEKNGKKLFILRLDLSDDFSEFIIAASLSLLWRGCNAQINKHKNVYHFWKIRER